MTKLYRVIIALFMLIMGLIFFIGTFIAGQSEPASSTNSGSNLILMILIASLVVIVVPGIFVLVRMTRR